jgi:hypothetical protein
VFCTFQRRTPYWPIHVSLSRFSAAPRKPGNSSASSWGKVNPGGCTSRVPLHTPDSAPAGLFAPLGLLHFGASRTGPAPRSLPPSACFTLGLPAQDLLPLACPPRLASLWSFPHRACSPSLPPLGLLHFGASRTGLAPPPPALPSHCWKPLGFCHCRLDHPGLGGPGQPPMGLGYLWGLRLLGKPARYFHPTFAPNWDCNPWGFNTQAFPQHASSQGSSPLLLLLRGCAPQASCPVPSPPGLLKSIVSPSLDLRAPGLPLWQVRPLPGLPTTGLDIWDFSVLQRVHLSKAWWKLEVHNEHCDAVRRRIGAKRRIVHVFVFVLSHRHCHFSDLLLFSTLERAESFLRN